MHTIPIKTKINVNFFIEASTYFLSFIVCLVFMLVFFLEVRTVGLFSLKGVKVGKLSAPDAGYE
jgi:hypothetical protein